MAVFKENRDEENRDGSHFRIKENRDGSHFRIIMMFYKFNY